MSCKVHLVSCHQHKNKTEEKIDAIFWNKTWSLNISLWCVDRINTCLCNFCVRDILLCLLSVCMRDTSSYACDRCSCLYPCICDILMWHVFVQLTYTCMYVMFMWCAYLCMNVIHSHACRVCTHVCRWCLPWSVCGICLYWYILMCVYIWCILVCVTHAHVWMWYFLVYISLFLSCLWVVHLKIQPTKR